MWAKLRPVGQLGFTCNCGIPVLQLSGRGQTFGLRLVWSGVLSDRKLVGRRWALSVSAIWTIVLLERCMHRVPISCFVIILVLPEMWASCIKSIEICTCQCPTSLWRWLLAANTLGLPVKQIMLQPLVSSVMRPSHDMWIYVLSNIFNETSSLSETLIKSDVNVKRYDNVECQLPFHVVCCSTMNVALSVGAFEDPVTVCTRNATFSYSSILIVKKSTGILNSYFKVNFWYVLIMHELQWSGTRI